MATKENLLYLFDRPLEPIFTKKDNDVTFNVPNNFLVDRYKEETPVISDRFGGSGTVIQVKNITPPDIRNIMALARDEEFSLWIPRHRKLAGRLIDIFLGMRTIDDLQSFAVYARDRVNPYLFQYAFATALIHRPDTKRIPIPSLMEMFPYKYVDSKIMRQIREETYVIDENNAQRRRPIIIPRDYTASDLDPEHRLWYFREDPGINLHHWHWHLVYPYEASNRAIVDKDRRGELFYYAHQQIIARYNSERLSNQLERVKRFGNNLREPIPEGYYPKMDSALSSRAWPGRYDNASIKDLNRELDQIKIDVADLERWRDRFLEAIHQMAVVNESGQRMPLSADGGTDSGIDTLGNMMESSDLSPNRQLYGNMHNMGHVFLAYVHDTTHKHLESFGVMNDSGTAMRDPIFYRWHAFIDNIFQEYKEQLTAYTAEQLTFSGITVDAVQLKTDGAQANLFQTFWNQSDVNFSRGLDFLPRGPVFVRFTHLNHKPFVYNIQINNRTGQMKYGMCRIFIAPRNDERGIPMFLRDQRTLMIEMDKFIVELKPGANVITQKSTDSTVTIPFDQTFRDLDASRPTAGSQQSEEFNFCGCGWPQHMLVPKGITAGMEYELFVMVSDYELDRIDQDLVGACNSAPAYCGIRDRKYPDRRPMGYPFDRLPRSNVETLSEFMTPNMRIQLVKIQHSDTTTPRV